MTSALQNRLVGTIILVALVVIFLPDFLDGKKESNNQVFVSVPPNIDKSEVVAPPPFPTQDVIDATRRPIEIINEQDVTDSAANQGIEEPPVITNDTSQDAVAGSSTSTQIDNSVTETANNERLDLNVKQPSSDNSLEQQTVIEQSASEADNAGWVVQLGSFRHQKNVQELLDKLDNAGYRAFSRKVDTSVGRLNKVFVGPELDRTKLDSALPHLTETTGLIGKVTTFDVATK